MVLTCIASCGKSDGGGSTMSTDISPVSLYIKEEGKVISLGLNYSDIDAELNLPVAKSETHDSLTMVQYGDAMKDNLIQIGFVDDKASLFILTQFSGKKYYTNSGLTIGASNVDFWKMYDVPDDMSYNDKMDARDYYAFLIVEDNGDYSTSIIGDSRVTSSAFSNYYCMYVMIDNKSFSCDVNKIVIGTPEAIKIYESWDIY